MPTLELTKEEIEFMCDTLTMLNIRAKRGTVHIEMKDLDICEAVLTKLRKNYENHTRSW